MNRWIDGKVARDRERGGRDRETCKVVVVVVVEWKERKKERNQERKKPRKKERKKKNASEGIEDADEGLRRRRRRVEGRRG